MARVLQSIRVGRKYRHYKGGRYSVIARGTHTETGEQFVAYMSEMGGQVWIRPYEMFAEYVEVNGVLRQRFVLIMTEREHAAKGLIRWASWFYDHAYRMNYQGKRRRERAYGRTGSRLQKVLLPLAVRLDREAAVEQMVRECWWG